jgi:hypothetical protein
MKEIDCKIINLKKGDKFYFGKTKRFIYQVVECYTTLIAARILNGRHPNSIRYYEKNIYVSKVLL